MNPKVTWFWTAVAAVLFAFIFLFERHWKKPPAGPPQVLPSLNASNVTGVQILPKGQLEIRVERTNGTWRLTNPFPYPAWGAKIDALLVALQHLTSATSLSAQELRFVRNADEKYGFEPPQETVVLDQGDAQTLLHVGFTTAPGDQVFLQVVGVGEVYVVNSDLLKLIPRNPDDWRDRRLVELKNVDFDRVLVTNSGKAFELQRNPTNRLWRMILPGWEPRADSGKVEAALRRLQELRVERFVSDDPHADLDSFGLQAPDLSVALAQGTNTQLLLEFGKSPTNNATRVYARRADLNSIVTVSKDVLGSWSHEGFRDRHLVTLTAPLSEIVVKARDQFTLQRQTNGAWRILPQGLPADPVLVNDLITNLCSLQVADFYKDVATAPDLTDKGLSPPLRRFILKTAVTNADGVSNAVLTELDFGTNLDDKIFARRTDENSLYTVKASDLARLPSASWEFRDRRIWNFTENDVAAIVIHQEGKTRTINRLGPHHWALAPGSQGMINDLAIEEVAHRLGDLSAAWWVERGDADRAAYGFKTNRLQLTIELKTGSKLKVEFGGTAPSRYPYAVTSLHGEPWIFEFPWSLYQYVELYLTIPKYIQH